MREVHCCYCGDEWDDSRMERLASLLALALERFLNGGVPNEARTPVDFSRDTSDYYEGMPAWGGERP